jgi:predicted lipoprotein with Yx(FWY)xxD motif
MKAISLLLFICVLGLIGCGNDDGDGDTAAKAGSDDTAMEKESGRKEKESGRKGKESGRKGTTITVGDSEFGSMLFDSSKQAIYVFEKDRKGGTVCYGTCAEEWPPVLTDGEPRPGKGVKASLLGTVKRRDGGVQVTYADKPLYLYAHEGPGEVRCHNVNLNGGFWWVVGPDGERRP